MILSDHAIDRMADYNLGKTHILATLIHGIEEPARHSGTGIPRRLYRYDDLVVVTEPAVTGDEVVVTAYIRTGGV
jgi:hypothetical protein